MEEDLEQPVIPESTSPDDAPALAEVDQNAAPGDEAVTLEADDSEEIDYEGEKYKVPKKLKDAFLRQSDYTVKTQEVAKQRQDFEAERQEFAARQQFQQQHIQAVAKVMAIDERLEQFSKLDWNAITDADPVQALKLDRQMRELQQQRAQQIEGINQSQARQAQESQQEIARRQQDAKAQLVKEIPGFDTPELQKKLLDVGKAAGYKAEELANVQDPRAVKLLHKAYLYDQLVAKAKTAPAASETIKPITRVAGAAANTQRDPAKMSDAEFNAWRRKQIAQRN